MRKETVDIGTLMASRNGDQKWTSQENSEVEPVQSVQMTSTKLITIEKIKEKDIILTMGQGLKKGTKQKTNRPTHSFL